MNVPRCTYATDKSTHTKSQQYKLPAYYSTNTQANHSRLYFIMRNHAQWQVYLNTYTYCWRGSDSNINQSNYGEG